MNLAMQIEPSWRHAQDQSIVVFIFSFFFKSSLPPQIGIGEGVTYEDPVIFSFPISGED